MDFDFPRVLILGIWFLKQPQNASWPSPRMFDPRFLVTLHAVSEYHRLTTHEVDKGHVISADKVNPGCLTRGYTAFGSVIVNIIRIYEEKTLGLMSGLMGSGGSSLPYFLSPTFHCWWWSQRVNSVVIFVIVIIVAVVLVHVIAGGDGLCCNIIYDSQRCV